VNVYLSGSGTGIYKTSIVNIIILGDGGASFTSGDIEINNYGDGTGNYTDGNIAVYNYGNQTGLYKNAGTGEELKTAPEPLAPYPALGTFPKMGTLKPVKACGTRITIDDSVLFDFNKDSLRPESKDTIANLATLFKDLKIKNATISGHTDSLDTDEYNQARSEGRANSVRQALLDQAVTTELSATGYGETKPVAPNEIKGKDNPSGRQANRRVEIFIPNGA
jgi:OOP family OmpA-OmpF porin